MQLFFLQAPSGLFQDKFLFPGHSQACSFPVITPGQGERQGGTAFLCVLRAAGHRLQHQHKAVVCEISLNLQAAIAIPEQGEEVERG